MTSSIINLQVAALLSLVLGCCIETWQYLGMGGGGRREGRGEGEEGEKDRGKNGVKGQCKTSL